MSQDHLHPVGGVDYPRTIQEFDKWFSSERACITYLQRARWPDGSRCPACDGGSAWMTARGLLRCAACQRQASLVAGTIFEGTRKSLRTWFQAMWFVTNQKSGGSALGLQRILGLSSYQTAWAWLHKLRRAMVRRGRDRLSGRVEVDETYLGDPEGGTRGRQREDKALIVVAAQEDGNGIGRIRMRAIPNASAASLVPFVEESIEPGSVVHTDGAAPGMLTVNGSARLSGTNFLEEISGGAAGTGYSVLDVTGAFSLLSSDTLTPLDLLGFTPVNGEDFFIINAAPISGTFANNNIAFAGESFTVDYNPTNVELVWNTTHVTPESASLLLFGTGLLGLAWLTRHRMRVGA